MLARNALKTLSILVFLSMAPMAFAKPGSLTLLALAQTPQALCAAAAQLDHRALTAPLPSGWQRELRGHFYLPTVDTVLIDSSNKLEVVFGPTGLVYAVNILAGARPKFLPTGVNADANYAALKKQLKNAIEKKESGELWWNTGYQGCQLYIRTADMSGQPRKKVSLMRLVLVDQLGAKLFSKEPYGPLFAETLGALDDSGIYRAPEDHVLLQKAFLKIDGYTKKHRNSLRHLDLTYKNKAYTLEMGIAQAREIRIHVQSPNAPKWFMGAFPGATLNDIRKYLSATSPAHVDTAERLLMLKVRLPVWRPVIGRPSRKAFVRVRYRFSRKTKKLHTLILQTQVGPAE